MARSIKLLSLALILAVSSGCSMFSPKAPDVDRAYSGFMDDYQPLNSVEVEEREFIAAKGWIAPQADLTAYQSIVVEPIKVDSNIKRDLQITDKVMASIQGYMTEALTEQLEAYYTASQGTQDRTLTARVAITGLETMDEPLRFYEYWPSALALTGVAKLIGTRDEDIFLFVEAEFVDAESHDVVAKTFVGMVGHERLENEWEELTVDKIHISIDQWIEHQVSALREASRKNYVVSRSPVLDDSLQTVPIQDLN